MGNHFVETLDAAFKHPGFSFVHIAQRCPKFNPSAWNFQDSSWLTFLVDEQAGIAADSKSAPDAKVQSYSPQSYEDAMAISKDVPNVFGLVYKAEKPMYDKLVLDVTKSQKQKDLDDLLNDYII